MEETIELKEIINIILKGKWIIIICTIIAVIISAIISWFVLEEQYESKAVVQIASGVQDTGIMSNYVATEFSPDIYMQRMKNEALMKQAFEEANYSPFVKSNLTLLHQPNTQQVELTYKASTAEEAQRHLSFLLERTKSEMNISVKETLNQLEQTYLSESNALSAEIEQLILNYNNIIVANKLPDVLILQTIASSQYVLNLTTEQTAVLSNITGSIQNDLLQLKAKIDTKTSEYYNVLTKYQSVKTGIDSFKPDPFVRVINEPSITMEPTSPNKILNLLIGLVLGMVIGMGILFGRSYYRSLK